MVLHLGIFILSALSISAQALHEPCLISGWEGVLTKGGCYSAEFVAAYDACRFNRTDVNQDLVPCNPKIFGKGVCTPKTADNRWTFSCLKTSAVATHAQDLAKQDQAHSLEIRRDALDVLRTTDLILERSAKIAKKKNELTLRISGISTRRKLIGELEAKRNHLADKRGFLRSKDVKADRADQIETLDRSITTEKEGLKEDYLIVATIANSNNEEITRANYRQSMEQIPAEVLAEWTERAKTMDLVFVNDQGEKDAAWGKQLESYVDQFVGQAQKTYDARTAELNTKDRKRNEELQKRQEELNALRDLTIDEDFLDGDSARKLAIQGLFDQDTEELKKFARLCSQVHIEQDQDDCLLVLNFFALKPSETTSVVECIPETEYGKQPAVDRLRNGLLDINAAQLELMLRRKE